MAVLESPADLSAYCLRRLGAPVINIEIDEAQISDRIDDTVEKFVESHFDGTTEVYKFHVITQKDVDKGYITPDKKFVAITEILDAGNNGSGSSMEAFERLNFNISQAETFQEMLAGHNSSMSGYYLTMSNLALFKDLLSTSRSFQFNSIRRYLNVSDPLVVGAVLILHGYESIDADRDVLVYNDRWVKKYATAQIKQQWGTNVKKYDGVQLPGGISMNGQTIYDEATAEIEKLDEEFSLRYELPVDFFSGPSFL